MPRLDLPPRACPFCLFGLCRLCTGRMTVLTVAGLARDVACWHEHPAGKGPTVGVRADAPRVAMAALTPDDPTLPADPDGDR